MSVPKANIQDVLDEGFAPSQFGTPANWDAAGGFIDKIVASAGRWTEQHIGAIVYADVTADSYANDCLVKAEVQYASAILYRRLIANLEAAAVSGLQHSSKLDPLKQMRDQAADSMQDARYWLAEAQRAEGVEVSLQGTGISSGILETGRYATLGSTP